VQAHGFGRIQGWGGDKRCLEKPNLVDPTFLVKCSVFQSWFQMPDFQLGLSNSKLVVTSLSGQSRLKQGRRSMIDDKTGKCSNPNCEFCGGPAATNTSAIMIMQSMPTILADKFIESILAALSHCSEYNKRALKRELRNLLDPEGE
jgi:hypothetical protein